MAYYVVLYMRKNVFMVVVLALSCPSVFPVGCVKMPASPMYYAVGPKKYLSDHGARLLIYQFMNDSIKNKAEALCLAGDVEYQVGDRAIFFNVISDKMAGAFNLHHSNVSRRFAMNCGVLIVELTDAGELDYMKLEYLSPYRRYHYERNSTHVGAVPAVNLELKYDATPAKP